MKAIVARERELAELDRMLHRALSGQMQIAIVTGEAGVGKTALTNAFRDEVTSRKDLEVHCAIGLCHGLTGGLHEPYLPFIQILQSLAKQLPGKRGRLDLRQLLIEVAPDWLAVIPAVGDAIAATVRTAQVVHRQLRGEVKSDSLNSRLIQYADLLGRISEETPLLLVIEDLHWSDNATIEMISFITDQLDNTRLMLLLTCRPAEVAALKDNQPHPVVRLLDKLRMREYSVDLPLSVLDRTGVEEYVVSRGQRFDQDLISQLWHQSGGNPLFLEQFILYLYERKLLKRAGGVTALIGSQESLGIPTTAHPTIAARLHLLPATYYQILEAASIQGEWFSSRVLCEVTEMNETDVARALRALSSSHQLVRVAPRRSSDLEWQGDHQFAHGLIQRVIYGELTELQRGLLHLKTGTVLEQWYAPEIRRWAGDLAMHFERGGDTRTAMEYYLTAGHNALAVMALKDAIGFAEAVRRLARVAPVQDESRLWHTQALVIIVEALCRASQYQESLQAFEEAQVFCPEDAYPELRARLLYWQSRALHSLTRRAEAVTAVRTAMSLIGDNSDDLWLKAALLTQLGALRLAVPVVEVRHALQEAVRIARENNLSDVLIDALLYSGWSQLGDDKAPQQALQTGREVLELSERAKRLPEQVASHRLLANACRRLGYLEESVRHGERAVELARIVALPGAVHGALTSMALTQKVAGDNWRAGLATMAEAIAVARQNSIPLKSSVVGDWCDLAIGTGEWQEAESALRELEAPEDGNLPTNWGVYFRQLGHYHLARGDLAKASTAFAKSAAAFADAGGRKEAVHRPLVYLGLTLALADKIREARDVLDPEIIYWREHGGSPELVAQALRGLSKTDMATKRSAEAIAKLQEACELVGDQVNTGPWPVRASVDLDLGRAFLIVGDLEQALLHATYAYQKYRRIGHVWLFKAAELMGRIMQEIGQEEVALAYLEEAALEQRRILADPV